jgi:hypothetical protein
MDKKIDQYLFYLLLILSFLPILYTLTVNILPSGTNRWGITEWLISYDGGFVRRGLTGELIKFLSATTRIAPSIIIVTITFITFLIFTFFILKITKDLVPKYVVLSPFLLGQAIFSTNMLRKDIFIMFLFFLCLQTLLSNLNKKFIFFLTTFISLIGVLSHESYIFFCLPILIISFNLLNNYGALSVKGFLFFFIPLTAFLFVLFFKGTYHQAELITENWNLINNDIAKNYCCYDFPQGSIEALSWSTAKNLSYTLDMIYTNYYGFISVPVVSFLSLCAGFFFIIKSIKSDKLKERNNFAQIFFIQTFFSLPIFIALDWGRWTIFILLTSLIATTLLSKKIELNFTSFFKKKLNFFTENNFVTKIFFIFFFSIPICCLNPTLYLVQTPAGSNFRALVYFFKPEYWFNFLSQSIGIFLNK